MSDSTTEQRSPVAILVSAHQLSSGEVRVVFDQVRANGDRFPQELRSEVFVTRTDVPAADLGAMQLAESRFQEIGETLMALLVPHVHRPE